ncbi:hypothetical protein LIA77_08229 [Sarocladium implicatum]|nr:hypothetical protein LIA77_08229 [Sarocladium implicatum]
MSFVGSEDEMKIKWTPVMIWGCLGMFHRRRKRPGHRCKSRTNSSWALKFEALFRKSTRRNDAEIDCLVGS